MKIDDFDFSLEPGRTLERVDYIDHKPIISIVMPYYNDAIYIEQTVNSVLNQTYPYFELLIIDDGSTDKNSLAKLEELKKVDKRIKIFHKKNEGLAATRDYGAYKAADKNSKYFVFLDSDDLIEKTYLEQVYWALETNPDASWAYTDTAGFGAFNYLWFKPFDSERMKKENLFVATAGIRKEAFFEVGGYELREKAVNEDWNFWLKLIAKGHYPVHISYVGFWYRRKKEGELKAASANRTRSMEIIENTVSKINKRVEAIQFPKFDYDFETIEDNLISVVVPKKKNNKKINLLIIVPWMVTGGADKFNYELIKRLDKSTYNIVLISSEVAINTFRQSFEQYSTVYSLTDFLEPQYWTSFINYIIEKENINLIFNTNSLYGYNLLPYLKAHHSNIPIIDYVHMEEWYYKNGGYARISSYISSVIDKTLVCNKSTENVFKKHFKREAKEVETVYIGVDSDKYNPDNYDKDEILAKYNLQDNTKYVISYICRIASQKRPFLLLEIMKRVVNNRDDVLFVIAGDGHMLPELKKMAKENWLNNNVAFLGNITNTEEIYKISDMTINCSIKEGLALTAYESLSMGVPVLTSDVGGQKELVDSSVGVIVPCLQKETDINDYNYTDEEIDNYVVGVDKILEDLDTYKSKCRKRILNKFTLEDMAKNMSKVFEDTVKKPNKQKINNGLELQKQQYLVKELISSYLYGSNLQYKNSIEEYIKDVYCVDGFDYYDKVKIDFITRLKWTLWKGKLWRKLTKTRAWKSLRNIVKK